MPDAPPEPTSTPSPLAGIERSGHVALVEMRRPPHNFFDVALLAALADAFETLEREDGCRAVVLAAQGRSFCAGADFSGGRRNDRGALYAQAARLFAMRKPVVAAVHGPAIGGGLGLALAADFRVTCPQARFSANFTRLGFHPGFGLTHTLPRLIGVQQAARLFYTGQRIDGARAHAIGLADELAESPEQTRERALALAAEIAASAPIAVESVRATLRAGLLQQVQAAIAHESAQQQLHFETADCREGLAAAAQRREPVFTRC
ncbi:MAG: enoyl-CoA hydratase/isomerase family protein [Burkholderiaceae bacterium]|jgi:enoyl-CoA hydratase/carnithine racemase|nr:enoyl-CoA hydratase/isomerase family protein [Burkholderiaceae bacterium]